MNTLASAFVCGIILCFAPPGETPYQSPKWQGRDLSYWKPRTQLPFTSKERTIAVTCMGVLASPSLHRGRDKTQASQWIAAEIIPTLTALVDDADKEVRWQAVRGLALAERDANTVAFPTLIQLLRDPDPKVQQMAAVAFGFRDMLSEPVAAGLIELIKSNTSEAARQSAARALRTGGPAGIAALQTLLNSPDVWVRAAAVSTFSFRSVTPPAVQPRIIELLDDADPDIQKSAAQAIVYFDPPPIKVLPKMLAHRNPDIIAQTIRSLLIPWSPAPVPCSDEVFVAISADLSLQKKFAGSMSRLGPRTIPILVKLLDDAEPRVRGSAAIGISPLGDAAKEAVPALKSLLTDMAVIERTSKKRVCHNAASALNSIFKTSQYSKDLPPLEPDGK
jgi:HEAT repeat protein